jgi:hypothetical protein
MTIASSRSYHAARPMRNVTPAARSRRRPWAIRLWLPLSILFLLLAPFALLAIPVLWLAAPLGRRDWAGPVFAAGAVLLALHGTRIEVRTPDINLSLELF